MMTAKNLIKKLRIKQRERYLQIKELESEDGEESKRKIENLKELIAADDYSIERENHH